MSEADRELLATPGGFARGVLGMNLTQKQFDVLQSIEPTMSLTALKSCNGAGKTSHIVAGAILWHVNVFPRGWVVSTAGVYRQVKDQLMPALRRYVGRFPDLQVIGTTIQDHAGTKRYIGFSTNDAGKFEGFHGHGDDAPLMIIVDESKTVEDPIFEAIARCRPERLLICSSPGGPQGEFYRAFKTKSQWYRTFTIKAVDCPWIKPEDIERDRKLWAGNQALLASMIDAEFMDTAEDCIVGLSDYERCSLTPPQWKNRDDVFAFCDFGAGIDENVLAVRRGNKVELVDCWRDRDSVASVGRFILHFKKQGLMPRQIAGDMGGIGHVILKLLAEAGWKIQAFNFGGRPRKPEAYVSAGAEAWIEGGEKIKRGDVILPEDDDMLRGQMISRKMKDGGKGRLSIERKEEMKARNLPSPDRADAVMGCLYGSSKMPVQNAFLGNEPVEFEWEGEAHEFEQMLTRTAGRSLCPAGA